jgi:hypothetical protein
LEELPGQIEAWEAEQVRCAKKLQDPQLYRTDPTALPKIEAESIALEAKIRAAYSRWKKLEAKMDRITLFVSSVLLFVQNTTAIPGPNSRALLLESIACSVRKIQRLNRIGGAIEDHELEQIVGTTLASQGIEHTLGIRAVRADKHNDRDGGAGGLHQRPVSTKPSGESTRDGFGKYCCESHRWNLC